MDDAERFVRSHGDGLSEKDRMTARNSSGGCYAFGMPEQVLAVGGQNVGDPKSVLSYRLTWQLYEVGPKDVSMLVDDVELRSFETIPERPWSLEVGPAPIFEMIRTGQVRWRIEEPSDRSPFHHADCVGWPSTQRRTVT